MFVKFWRDALTNFRHSYGKARRVSKRSYAVTLKTSPRFGPSRYDKEHCKSNVGLNFSLTKEKSQLKIMTPADFVVTESTRNVGRGIEIVPLVAL